jgi:hypothetical protein
MNYRAIRIVLFLLAAILPATSSATAEIIKAGSQFPEIQLPAPADEQGREYLGLKGDSFQVSEVVADLFVLEIIGVYCPQCHRQAPLFNRLAARLHKDPVTAGRVKFAAMASGATVNELEYLKKEFKAPFPLIHETGFAIHKQLGEPKTPFTIIVRNSEVVYTHLGVIEDIDGLFKRIAALLP